MLYLVLQGILGLALSLRLKFTCKTYVKLGTDITKAQVISTKNIPRIDLPDTWRRFVSKSVDSALNAVVILNKFLKIIPYCNKGWYLHGQLK